MNNSIEDDDKKFNKLITKQHSTCESFVSANSKPADSIEEDDEKLEKLLFFQDLTQTENKHESLEEKYEQEIIMEQISKKWMKSLEEDTDIVDRLEEFLGVVKEEIQIKDEFSVKKEDKR